jgi:hypothetical protein
MRRENQFLSWQKTASRLVPAHSKTPRSRETPNVISVRTELMPISLRKLRKLADVVSWVVQGQAGRTYDRLQCS